jgi:cytidylate kinase
MDGIHIVDKGLHRLVHTVNGTVNGMLLHTFIALHKEQILDDIIQRDKRDMGREIAPLKKADDAIVVDTSELDFKQSLEYLLKIIAEHR